MFTFHEYLKEIMDDSKKSENANPPGEKKKGNNFHSPAKPARDKLKAAMIDLSIIVMITVVGNYVRIYYADLTNVFVKDTLKAAWSLCILACFMHTHKSFIANLNFGVSYRHVGDRIDMLMSNDENVKVGRNDTVDFIKKRLGYLHILLKRRKI